MPYKIKYFLAMISGLILLSAIHFFIVDNYGRPIVAGDYIGKLQSVSLSPFPRDSDPRRDDVQPEQIRRDVAAVSKIAERIRIYSVSHGLSRVVGEARTHGMRVSVGIWVGTDQERTRRELAIVRDLAATHPNIFDVVVGNESILREEATPREIIDLMKVTRRTTGKPVSTGEPWDVWIKNPELSWEADFILAHILPFWEGIPAEKAVETAFDRIRELREHFPDKHIVVGEFGWPSQKFNFKDAEATPENQIRVVRDFVTRAERERIPYNIVEAIDQPWKTSIEGDVGPYWGILNADRDPKFAFSGESEIDPNRLHRGAAGATIGFGLSLWILILRRRRPVEILVTAIVAQFIGWAAALTFWIPFETYVDLGHIVAWIASAPLLAILAVLTLDRVREILEIVIGHRPKRLLTIEPGGRSDRPLPKVSIHIPACREPVEMLKTTLRSVAALDYPDYEVLVIVNNTTQVELVEPIREECAILGERFRFIHLPQVSGFKAGALNEGLRRTHPDARIIALLDADYTVETDWLRDLVPAFENPRMGIVQAPQEHRDTDRSMIARAMNSEYAGFFDAGMVQRNEANAIIAHGTMLLIRRDALEDAGGWSEWCITEDTELGLRLIERGYLTNYTRRRYGAGLLPDTVEAFRKQRDRWAYGAMRIMLAHGRHFRPGSSSLTASQRFHFGMGWLHWVGDGAAVCLAVMNLLWAAVMIVIGEGEPPHKALTIGTSIAAGIAILHMIVIHTYRVRRGFLDAVLAAWAGMALQFVIARAVLRGLVITNLPFHVTAKGGRKKGDGLADIIRGHRWEIALAVGLPVAAISVYLTNWPQIFELDAFALMLAIQSIPFIASVTFVLADHLTRRRR